MIGNIHPSGSNGKETLSDHINYFRGREHNHDEEETPEKDFGVFKDVVRLNYYYPTNEVRLAQAERIDYQSLFNDNGSMRQYLDCRKLEQNNITQVLSLLIQIEDASAMKPYNRLYQKHVVVARDNNKRDDLIFEINLPESVKIEKIVRCKSDEVVFVPSKFKCPRELLMKVEETDILQFHVGILDQIIENTVYVGDIPPSIKLLEYYDIIFRPNRSTFRIQHMALGLVDHVKCQYIFPTKVLAKVDVTETMGLEIINKQICANPEQLQAVERIVGGANPHAPYIVVGPPGTGKTTTIVEAVLQLCLRDPYCHILITAGSNSACDTVALKICEYFEKHPMFTESPKDILRVFSKSWSGRNAILMKYGNFLGNEIVTPSVDVLLNYNIIVVTLCTMGRLRTGMPVNWPVTHVFIDEAGAITEPETLVAITSVNTSRCRIILSGDTKQLGAVVMSRVVADLGLKRSLMERLLERECYAVKEDGTYDSTLQTRLRRNYRSHPEILRLFNHLYYKDELIAEGKIDRLFPWNKLNILANKKFPIIFEAVYGKLGKSQISQSSYNQEEVRKVVGIIENLRQHVNASKIGVISPYKLQCTKIKRELQQKNLNNIEVGTSESFQGHEKHIIIASFVKSNNQLGFIADKQRLNGILSRAQSLLVLVGNPETLQSNDDFKYLIEECKRMGTFRRMI